MALNTPPGAPGPATPPLGPSAVAPHPQEGLRAQSRIKIGNAAKMLTDTLGTLKGDLNSEEGKAVLNALKALAPVVPEVAEGMGQTEIQSMLAQAQPVKPGPGQAPATMLGTPSPRPSPLGVMSR